MRRRFYKKEIFKRTTQRNEIIFQRYLQIRKKGLSIEQVYELLSSVVWFCEGKPICLTPDTIKRIIYKKKYERGEKKRAYKWRRK